MSGVIRTWGCLNCNRQFDSWDNMPECPDCGCVRVTWVPGGGHIAGVSRRGDAEFRALADVFKLDDMHSAREGEAAKKLRPSPVSAQDSPHDFGGFVANINPNVGPQCVPTANHVNFKAKMEIGRAFGAGQLGMPNVKANTVIDASHRPKP